VLLLAPVWMQMLHLLLADGVWIALVLLSASVLSESTHSRSTPGVGGPPGGPLPE
jgi:hypothetical protein